MIRKIILIALILFISGCAKKEFGEKVQIKKFTPVLHLKKHPENFLNQYVKIKGKVVEQSEYGSWITLQDNYIIIMVKLEKFSGIPKMLNKTAKVIGKLIRSENGYCMDAKWLKID